MSNLKETEKRDKGEAVLPSRPLIGSTAAVQGNAERKPVIIDSASNEIEVIIYIKDLPRWKPNITINPILFDDDE